MQTMKNLLCASAAAAAPLLAVVPPAAAQALTMQQTWQVDGVVDAALAKTGTPSASIAVVRGARILLAKTYGKASDATPRARADQKYQIASIYKQFTAALLLTLEDDGKLSLDDTVAKWISGVTDGDRITIRELLSHTSGLQDYWPQDYSPATMKHPVTPQQIIDGWAKKPLDLMPGTKWQYSNTGYVVAGLIAEKAGGAPLLDQLRARIFKPLGIDPINQDFAIGEGYPSPHHRYALGAVRVEKPAAPGWLFAANELAMSANDLAKWDIPRIERGIMPADDWIAQETPVKLTDSSSTGKGLGVTVGTADSRQTIAHSGEAVGFLSQNTVYSSDKAAIVVLTNGDFGDATTTITKGIAAIVLPASASPDDAKGMATARSLFDSLRNGTLDRTHLTADAAYYFTPTATRGYHDSLAPLGEPTSFELIRAPRLRGGFVNRNYTVTYPGRTLTIVTYAEPGENGKWEQFLVMPAN